MEAPDTTPTALESFYLYATLAHPVHDIVFWAGNVTDSYGAPIAESLYTLAVNESGGTAAVFTYWRAHVNIVGAYRLRFQLLVWRGCVAATVYYHPSLC